MPFHAVGWFCDDVRQEKGNKETFVGVYSDTVHVGKIPGGFKRINLMVRIHVEMDINLTEIRLFLRSPNSEEAEIANFPLEGFEDARKAARERGMPFVMIGAQVTLENFKIAAEGILEAIVRVNEERQTVAAMLIRPRPINPSTASPQPSSQSPSGA
jgi:hypothetical protein